MKISPEKSGEIFICGSFFQSNPYGYLTSLVLYKENAMLTSNMETITASEYCTGILYRSIRIIFMPTNARMKASPIGRYLKRSIIHARAKYKDRRPIIAKTFEV